MAGGKTVTVDASPTTDPDGDTPSYLWWRYYGADTANAEATVSNETSATGTSFTVPSEPGKNPHIILEVTDRGESRNNCGAISRVFEDEGRNRIVGFAVSP